MKRIGGQESFQQGVVGLSANLQCAVRIAVQPGQIVRDKGIGRTHGHANELCCGLDAITFLMHHVLSVQQHHLVSIMAYNTIYIMSAVLIGKIHHVQPHIAQRVVFVLHAFHLHVSAQCKTAVRLYIVNIALQESLYAGHIRHHHGQLSQVQVVDVEREVLLGFFVGDGIELYARSVIGQQVH